MCKWVLKSASPGLWFLLSGLPTTLPWQAPHQLSPGGGLGTEKSKRRAEWCIRLPPSCVVLRLVCGCDPGPTSPTANLPLSSRGSYFLGMVATAERACLACASISLPTFWATGVVASLECLLILVFRDFPFYCLVVVVFLLFPSQASVSTVLYSSAPLCLAELELQRHVENKLLFGK